MDVPKPRFSWNLIHSSRAQAQSAFQLLVSASPAVAVGDMWDYTEKSDRQSQVVYDGAVLRSDTTYYWKVRWWDSGMGVSDYSEIASFDTGFFSSRDWNATWIGGFNMLRKDFILSSVPVRGRAFICGIGYHELYINGQRVGNNQLDPGWTDFTKRDYYVVHDVTSLLQKGSNTAGVLLGGGWWSQGQKGQVSLLFQLSVDGKTVVLSDNTWKGIQGPIIMDSIYNGETYDARMEQPGWNKPNFDDSKWSAAIKVPVPGGKVSAQMIPPIKIHNILKPVTMTQPQSGVYVFDFEQNFSGWVKLRVTGNAGQTVILRHAEILQHNGNGMIYTDNLRSAKATDTYILKGDPNGEVYEPRFTYHGFRFVELTGFPGTPDLNTIEARHVFSSVSTIGQFISNSEVLNQLQSNVWWGQSSNLMSVPTDCDQRDERLGWMADAQLSAAEAMNNFDLNAFYSAWVTLMQDNELNGGIADVVPFVRYGNRPGDPAWSAAFPMLIFELWERNNDLSVVKNHYDGLTAYINFLESKARENSLGNMFAFYGDWVPPPPAPRTSIHMTASWYFILSTRQIARMAKAIGKDSDYQKYNQWYAKYSQLFNQAFYRNSTHLYDIGMQTSLVLPLHLHMVPHGELANVSINLLNDIVGRGTHLSTGILGTKYLPIVLTDMGRTDLALDLALTTTYPSWGYMIYQSLEASATTFWELWDSPNEGPGMNSRNHIMFGSVGDWFYTTLAGIRQTGAGFKHIVIRPPPTGVLVQSELTTVTASTVVPPGNVSASWIVQGGSICGAAPETATLQLSCGGKQGGVIKSVDFASFGTPQGSCGFYSYSSCNAATSKQIVEKLCLGKESCSVPALDTEFGDPCFGTVKKLAVQVTCSGAKGYQLNTNIPVNSDATIHVSKMALSGVTIQESGTVVWANNEYQPGVAGIESARDHEGHIVFNVGSGSYSFAVSGTPGTTVCATAKENQQLTLTCPSAKRITVINFASFGTPTGSCGSLGYGTCHAGSSKYAIEKACLFKTHCTFTAADYVFGDPCYGTLKTLSVQVTCS